MSLPGCKSPVVFHNGPSQSQPNVSKEILLIYIVIPIFARLCMHVYQITIESVVLSYSYATFVSVYIHVTLDMHNYLPVYSCTIYCLTSCTKFTFQHRMKKHCMYTIEILNTSACK